MKIRWNKVIGMFLAFAGITTFYFGGYAGITGMAISGELSEISSAWYYILGSIMILAGLALNKASLEQSVAEAARRGVPVEEALRIKEESDKKVESGEWIKLRNITITSSNQNRFPGGTSQASYWGPKKYSNSTNRNLKKLYNEGKIGKTHEILRGSDIYRITKPVKKEGRYSREELEDEEKTVSPPSEASRVLHRHWEIEQMYRRESGKYR